MKLCAHCNERKGTERTLVRELRICRACERERLAPGAFCSRCKNQGTIDCPECDGEGTVTCDNDCEHECRACDGAKTKTCPRCDGKSRTSATPMPAAPVLFTDAATEAIQ
jgi:hypothetical protein